MKLVKNSAIMQKVIGLNLVAFESRKCKFLQDGIPVLSVNNVTLNCSDKNIPFFIYFF